MNSSSTPELSPAAPSGRSLKAMWATIGALAVAVLAMGGVLLHQKSGSDASPPAPVAAVAPVPAPDDFKPPTPQPGIAPPPVPVAAPPEAVAAVPVPPPVRAPEPGAPLAAQAGVPPQPAVVAPAPVRACRVCGRVESVTAVHRQQPTSGVGAVAGGVLGGVLGHQIGSGNGRTAATVLGAVGGGFAGNEVEKRTHTVTLYEVSVRMQDGSLRHVETGTAPPIGKAVTLQGNVLKPADGHP